MTPEISIIIPLYNEMEVFQELINRLDAIIESSPLSIEVLLIDDGSQDSTTQLIEEKCLIDKNYQGIILSRNFGHQIAVSAGLSNANASKAVMVIDGDLQDPPELLNDFYEKIKEGYDVAYGIRKKRKEHFLKKIAYSTFYKTLKKTSSINIPLDSGDFCMMSRRVVNIINSMQEESRFVRGMRSWVGFKQTGVEYNRPKRAAGDPSYSFKQLVKLALNGYYNFSEFPIQFIKRIASSALLISLVYFLIVVYKRLLYNSVPEGFTATLFIIIFFAGIQLFAISIVGEYVTRIFFQVKKRPLYIIDKKIRDNKIVKTKNLEEYQ